LAGSGAGVEGAQRRPRGGGLWRAQSAIAASNHRGEGACTRGAPVPAKDTILAASGSRTADAGQVTLHTQRLPRLQQAADPRERQPTTAESAPSGAEPNGALLCSMEIAGGG
jgi:hypothetical protein